MQSPTNAAIGGVHSRAAPLRAGCSTQPVGISARILVPTFRIDVNSVYCSHVVDYSFDSTVIVLHTQGAPIPEPIYYP